MSDLNNPTLWEISCETSHDGIDVLETIDVTPCPDGRFVHIDDYKAAIDRLTAERDAAVAERDAVRNAIGNDMLKSYIEKHGDPIPLVLALEEYKVDASRWNELCRQVDLTMFPCAILDDAMAMGAGALELYIDEAMKEQEQGK